MKIWSGRGVMWYAVKWNVVVRWDWAAKEECGGRSSLLRRIHEETHPLSRVPLVPRPVGPVSKSFFLLPLGGGLQGGGRLFLSE